MVILLYQNGNAPMWCPIYEFYTYRAQYEFYTYRAQISLIVLVSDAQSSSYCIFKSSQFANGIKKI